MTGAGLIDRSALGKATVTGRDRASFLQGMLSNDVKGLAPGQGCPAAFLDAHGKVVSLLAVYVLEDQILLELPAGSTEKFLQSIDKFLISEKAYFEPADEGFAIVSVQGPKAANVLAQVSGVSLELEPYAHAEVTVAGAPVRVINRSDAVTSGFHCWTAPDHAAALWKALREAGAMPVGADAVEILRVEAGIAPSDRGGGDTGIPPGTRLGTPRHHTKGCSIGPEDGRPREEPGPN